MKAVPISRFSYNRNENKLYIDMAELETLAMRVVGGLTFSICGKNETVAYGPGRRIMDDEGEVIAFIYSPYINTSSTGRTLPIVYAFND